MLGVYLFAAIVGAGLLVFSMFAGPDAHHDVADDHPGDLVVAFLKPRNFVFGAAGFGLTGTILTLLNAGVLLTPLGAAAMGVGFFFLSHVVFSVLKQTETATGALREGELLGERARVTLPLEPGRPGRVALVVAGREIYLTARLAPPSQDRISAGDEVVVIRVSNGVAEVATPEQYERQLTA